MTDRAPQLMTAAELTAAGYETEPILRAIRRKCLDCSGGDRAEVADCLVPDCALFPFRMGKNPWRAPPSEERREAGRRAAAKLKKPGAIPRSDATGERGATTLPDRMEFASTAAPATAGEEVPHG